MYDEIPGKENYNVKSKEGNKYNCEDVQGVFKQTTK